MSTEDARVALLARIFGVGSAGVPVGIGDDAAVLEGGLVVTVDAQIEGTHFRRAWLSWEDVGFRSFMAAASDLAAMGARPLGVVSALVLDPSVDDAALEALARGQAEAARAVGTTVVGGNLARGRETSITTTVLGRADRPLLRSGAKAGDGVWVAGELGLAGEATARLLRGENVHDARIWDAFRRPRARIDEGCFAAASGATAGIDVSDGLACDLGRLADASGVSITLHANALEGDLAMILGGGEDYALVVTAPWDEADGRFRRIGTVGARSDAPLYLAEEGTTRPIEPRGFDHFAG